MSNKLAIQVISENPIAAELCRTWYLNKMQKSMAEDDMAQEFQEEMLKRGVSDHVLSIIFEDSPRMFFDVLDENNLYITIYIHNLHDKLFYYRIDNLLGGIWYDGDNSEHIKGRVNCERAAVEKAFSMLT